MSSRKYLAENIKHYRKLAGLTQADLAMEVKTTQASVARWESGDTEVSLDYLDALAAALGVSAPALISNPADTDLAGLPPELKAHLGQYDYRQATAILALLEGYQVAVSARLKGK